MTTEELTQWVEGHFSCAFSYQSEDKCDFGIFETLCSGGVKAEGEPVRETFPTPEEAVESFKADFDSWHASQMGTVLVWRIRPELCSWHSDELLKAGGVYYDIDETPFVRENWDRKKAFQNENPPDLFAVYCRLVALSNL